MKINLVSSSGSPSVHIDADILADGSLQLSGQDVGELPLSRRPLATSEAITPAVPTAPERRPTSNSAPPAEPMLAPPTEEPILPPSPTELAETAGPPASEAPIPVGTPEIQVTLPAGSLLPKGKPVSSWNGLPTMPGVIACDESEGSYSYTVKATPKQIQSFYEQALGKLGWKALAASSGDSENSMIFFTKDTETATIAILIQRGYFFSFAGQTIT